MCGVRCHKAISMDVSEASTLDIAQNSWNRKTAQMRVIPVLYGVGNYKSVLSLEMPVGQMASLIKLCRFLMLLEIHSASA